MRPSNCPETLQSPVPAHSGLMGSFWREYRQVTGAGLAWHRDQQQLCGTSAGSRFTRCRVTYRQIHRSGMRPTTPNVVVLRMDNFGARNQIALSMPNVNVSGVVSWATYPGRSCHRGGIPNFLDVFGSEGGCSTLSTSFVSQPHLHVLRLIVSFFEVREPIMGHGFGSNMPRAH